MLIAPISSEVFGLISNLVRSDSSGYSLRMFWLGRYDKLQSNELPALDWLTRHCLPPEIRANFDGFKPGKVHFQGEDHHSLALAAMAHASAALLSCEQSQVLPR